MGAPKKRIGRLVAGAALLVALVGSTVASAATYSFSGISGNTGDGSPDPYGFGVLASGTSTFTATNNDFIPFPSGSNHGFSNLFTFTLATDATVNLSVGPGAIPEIISVGLNYSRFDNPLYNSCCELLMSNGGSGNPELSQPVVLSTFLLAGNYEFGVLGIYPAAGPDTAPYFSETYGGSIGVAANVSAVPLPSSGTLMIAGLLCFGGIGIVANRSRRTTCQVRQAA